MSNKDEQRERWKQLEEEHRIHMSMAPRCRCGSEGGICHTCGVGLCDDCKHSHGHWVSQNSNRE